MDLNKTILSLFDTEKAFHIGVNGMVTDTLLIGQALCVLFVPLSLGWNIITKSADNLDSGDPAGKWLWSWKEVGRLIVLYTLINIAYRPICAELFNLSHFLTKITFIKEVVKVGQEPSKTSFWDISIYTILQELINWIARIISYVMTAFACCVSRILYVFGPLVIAFSILPTFKDKLAGWFGMFLNCLCVPFTLNVINGIYQKMHTALTKGSEIDAPVFLVVNITYIIVIFLAFWFTSFYVGSSAGSKVLSMAATAATVVAAKGMKMASGGKGGGGGESTNPKEGGGNANNPIEK